MSRDSKAKTHTSDAFVDFAYDLLDYAMHYYGVAWCKPEDYERRSTKMFREDFGDVVMIVRSRNRVDFNTLFSLVSELDDNEAILESVEEIRQDIFKGNIPLMEFISYCAFLLDMALVCIQLEDIDLLYQIVDDTADVFNEHIKSYFTIIGGWFALYRVAKQYAMYINL